jgi:uncharacterized membrane protein HdeD (DUF308 family)
MLRGLDTEAPDRRVTVTSLALVTLGLGLLALVTPLTPAESPATRVGGLLALAACIEALHALRRSTGAARRRATIGAVISMTIALFLINAPFVAGAAPPRCRVVWIGRYSLRDRHHPQLKPP